MIEAGNKPLSGSSCAVPKPGGFGKPAKLNRRLIPRRSLSRGHTSIESAWVKPSYQDAVRNLPV